MKRAVYPVLVGMMAERAVKKADVAKEAGVSPQTLYSKMYGTTDFTLTEAERIHRRFFPDVEKEKLFQRVDMEPFEMTDSVAVGQAAGPGA